MGEVRAAPGEGAVLQRFHRSSSFFVHRETDFV